MLEARFVASAPAAPVPADQPARTLRQAAADFWLALLFRHAPRYTPFLRRHEWFFCGGTFRVSKKVRHATLTNARRILGSAAKQEDVKATAYAILKNFFRFCCDVGAGSNATAGELLKRIDSVEGKDSYRAARAGGKGVIILTAHMGSFEVGLAALKEIEQTIHVVFRRDPHGGFDLSRRALRSRLGVIEAPVDEGWTIWMRLRDALLRDEAVVLQGDRVMPGQKGQPIPFLDGHLMIPAGPMKLAQATGAPIVPIFTFRLPNEKLRVIIEPRLQGDNVDELMQQWAGVLERVVRQHPDQWLLLQPALCEDAAPGIRSNQ